MTVPHDPTRRTLLQLGAATGLVATPTMAGSRTSKRAVKAIAFDAFPIFNPNSAFDVLRRRIPDQPDLSAAWFQRAFAETWLRTSANRYAPLDVVLAETLDYAAASASAPLTPAIRAEVLAAFRALDVWPDVRDRLSQLKAAGLRLVFLSNMSEATLRANLRRANLEPLFEAVLSTDRVGAFKPAPQAYALAMRALRLPKDEILFAPFAAWDAAGAAWFGYPTAWVNRARQRAEPGAPEVRAGPDLEVVIEAALG